jgi:hypothetical protein
MDNPDLKIMNWIRLGAILFAAMSLLAQPSVKLDGFEEKVGTFYGQF